MKFLTANCQTRLYTTTLYERGNQQLEYRKHATVIATTDTFSGMLRAGGISTLQTVTLAGGATGLLTGDSANIMMKV